MGPAAPRTWKITAGGAGFTDPAFTVRPSMDVPAPPEVDTARTRDSIRSIKNSWTNTWKAWSIKSALSSWLDFMANPTEGVQGASTERNAARILGFVRSSMTLGEEAKVESNRFSVGGLSVERGEIRLRGRVRLG